LAAAENFDAVLLDIMMPEIDGPSVLRALRASERTRDLPVVFISAKDAAADWAVAQMGARGVIRKPFDPARVADQVLSLLGCQGTAARADAIPHELRRSFLLSAVDRVDGIDRALDALQRQLGAREHLDDARAGFHRVAGAAASYGFAEISDAAS